MTEFIHKDLSKKVIGAFYTVYNTLGYGFLEKVYENALCVELKSQGVYVESQVAIEVFYKEERVGLYYADLLIDKCLIVELKAAENLCEEHEYQLLNYLKGTNIEIGLLLNFGREPQFKRLIFTNDRKNL